MMRRRVFTLSLFWVLFAGRNGFAMDRPGGLTEIASGGAPGSYELHLNPAYVLSPAGSYLTSQLDYQINDDVAVGFGLGSGQVGYSLGAQATWFLFPDTSHQPASAILTGVYLNRFGSANYLLTKIAPMLSKTFSAGFGTVSPYGAFQVSPSFDLGGGANEICLKMSAGSYFVPKSLGGIRLWVELGLGLAASVSEVVWGVSYPFTALAE